MCQTYVQAYVMFWNVTKHEMITWGDRSRQICFPAYHVQSLSKQAAINLPTSLCTVMPRNNSAMLLPMHLIRRCSDLAPSPPE